MYYVRHFYRKMSTCNNVLDCSKHRSFVVLLLLDTLLNVNCLQNCCIFIHFSGAQPMPMYRLAVGGGLWLHHCGLHGRPHQCVGSSH